ncbi:hypothetical protein PoB_004594700 [Plakobranchus ocellatus]|uniref:Uncharacterized protein n=1 Tax=Plakobranchus ocellatus TaxID=259542 RepID=A0AAV4BKL1_9GAST|nr:hypothetical protein PoB_004594700 [Plakobranchus ocellatus]
MEEDGELEEGKEWEKKGKMYEEEEGEEEEEEEEDLKLSTHSAVAVLLADDITTRHTLPSRQLISPHGSVFCMGALGGIKGDGAATTFRTCVKVLKVLDGMRFFSALVAVKAVLKTDFGKTVCVVELETGLRGRKIDAEAKVGSGQER